MSFARKLHDLRVEKRLSLQDVAVPDSAVLGDVGTDGDGAGTGPALVAMLMQAADFDFAAGSPLTRPPGRRGP